MSTQTLLTLLKRALDILQAVIVGVGGLVLILWFFPPIREWLTARTGLGSDLTLAVVALLLAMVFRYLFALNSQLGRFFNPPNQEVIIGGVNAVYAQLEQTVCASRAFALPQGSRELRVLGLTLFTAWPWLEGLIREGKLAGVAVRLLCLDPDFILGHPATLNPCWASQARAQLDQIASYIGANATYLAEQHIEIEVRTYDTFPGLHGFYYSDGSLFVSFAHWEASGQVRPPYDFYESFAGADFSPRASQYRRLFLNWQEHSWTTGKASPAVTVPATVPRT